MKNLFSRLKSHFQKLRENLKPMTFWEKVDHIFTYYKIYMLIVLVAITLIAIIISAIGNMGIQYYNCGIMCNVEVSREGHAYLTEEFFVKRLGNPEGKTYLTATTLETQEYTVQDTENRYRSYMGVLGQVEARELDYMLLDEFSFGFYADDRIYMDLSQLLSQEEMENLYGRNMVVMLREEDTQEAAPMAIDLTNTDFAADCMLTEGKVYLVFIRNSEDPQNCIKLLDHILQWQKKPAQ